VEDPRALASALAERRGAEQVLIDSAGRNPFSAGDMAELRDLLNSGNIEPILVLPAGGDAAEAVELSAAFREVGVTRLVLTRVDMTRRLGSVLAAAFGGGLKFSEVSVTARVAEGLTPLNPLALARLIVPAQDVGSGSLAPLRTRGAG
jgi:flagellar biosynthesis protein FlhF